MSAAVDILDPERPKRIVIVASNPAVSEQTSWPIGFWWAELTHPFLEFTECGYEVDIASPDGGPLRADAYSDPRDDSRYSAEDLISLGFINSPAHMKLIEQSKPLAGVRVDDYDGALLVGGQGPMYTFVDDEQVQGLVAAFYEAGKPTAVICHAVCVLLKTRLADGRLLVDGKTWTGFANSEERYADDAAGLKIQPFWIEDEARKLEDTNFIVNARFKPHAVRDGNLITGQQQYSGRAAARLMIEALGLSKPMLAGHPIDPMILAADLAVAREFYGGRIGLEVLIESDDFLTFGCGGDSRLVVTRSSTGTTEPQTKASWRVSDLAAEVAELRSRGVEVEHYEELNTVDGIADVGFALAAWLVDPHGNSIGLLQFKSPS